MDTEKTIKRQRSKSRQPRFNQTAAYYSLLGWLRITEMDAPAYSAESMQRDQWLRSAWRLEPHLAGVVNAVCLIDSNRGWELVGGRNQVARYTAVLHDADEIGWRMYIRKAALSYWCTDLGAVSEIGRDGMGGPLRALWHVDSARCRLTGLRDTPLEYQPSVGGYQRWQPSDYFRIASLPSDDESLRGLGFCAISRCLETVRLLYAVMLHDQEQVAARAPKGLLLLQGISEQQWKTSLEARNEALDSLDRRYYGGVQVLASAGLEQIDAKLVALSQLPANFDAKAFVDSCMYAFALAFGYDPSEFWPVQFGSLGRGTETEVQHLKATGKGGVDFALSYQEQLQRELPPTLHWEFEQRDDNGELVQESVKQAKVKTITDLYTGGGSAAGGLISREEGRQMAAEAGIIPEEWTLIEEDVTATDTEEAEEANTATPEAQTANEAPQPAQEPTAPVQQKRQVERLLETPEVQWAIRCWPGAEIVRYTWQQGRATVRTIWTPRRIFRGHRVQRADDVLYKSGDVEITSADVDAAIKAARERVGEEFAQLLEAPVGAP